MDAWFWSLSGTWWRPKEDNINQHYSPLHTGINLQERGKTLSWDEMVIQLKEKEMHFQRLLSSNFVLFNYVRKASNCQGPEVHYLPCCLEPTSKQTLAYINTKLSGGTNCSSGPLGKLLKKSKSNTNQLLLSRRGPTFSRMFQTI